MFPPVSPNLMSSRLINLISAVCAIATGLTLTSSSLANPGDLYVTDLATGSIIVLIVWVYYSAQIFFMGAEFTKVYAGKHGSQVARRAEMQDRRQGRVLETAT